MCKVSGIVIFVGLVFLAIVMVPLILFGTRSISHHVGDVRQVVHEVANEARQVKDDLLDAAHDLDRASDDLSHAFGDIDKELDEFTKPRIDLGEKAETPATEEEEPAEKSATELKSEPKLGEPLPAWVTNPPKSEEGVWQRVVATEPCFTKESLARTQEELIRKTLAGYWAKQVHERIPEKFSRWLGRHSDRPGVVLDLFTEHRETSVGEAFVAHILFRIDESDNEWLTQQWKEWQADERLANRGMRAAGVGLLSGAVLCGLAVLYGLLRMSEK